MTVSCENQSNVDIKEAALTMAVAVVVERILGLNKSDKDDLFELTKALCAAESDEEVQASVAGIREILDQANRPVRAMQLPAQPHVGVTKWIEYAAGKIRSARKDAGLTQEQLAERAGLPQSHISRLESNMHSPSQSTLEKIAKAVDKPLSYFDPSESGCNAGTEG